jgi:hypothetical protein
VTKLTTLLLGVSLTLLPRAGCAVGPNYIETRVDVPDMYRGTIPGGRIRSRVKYSEAREREIVVTISRRSSKLFAGSRTHSHSLTLKRMSLQHCSRFIKT